MCLPSRPSACPRPIQPEPTTSPVCRVFLPQPFANAFRRFHCGWNGENRSQTGGGAASESGATAFQLRRVRRMVAAMARAPPARSRTPPPIPSAISDPPSRPVVGSPPDPPDTVTAAVPPADVAEIAAML